ncbi:MAG: hypothetical protein K8T10_01380 [Candidatus Eremiobacteraeota bacterium]|nr:hypothetical protein [Candidatus Eremiobacteraeota bacterium]
MRADMVEEVSLQEWHPAAKIEAVCPYYRGWKPNLSRLEASPTIIYLYIENEKVSLVFSRNSKLVVLHQLNMPVILG